MIMKIRRSCKDRSPGRYRSLGLLLIILGGLTGFALAETGAQGPATPVSLEKLRQEPQQYLDRVLVLEGVLEAQGKGSRPPYLLRSESGAAIQVSPWAPLEIYRPRVGAPKVKSMAYFVGRRLRLTGRLVSRGEKFILQVNSAEEL